MMRYSGFRDHTFKVADDAGAPWCIGCRSPMAPAIPETWQRLEAMQEMHTRKGDRIVWHVPLGYVHNEHCMTLFMDRLDGSNAE